MNIRKINKKKTKKEKIKIVFIIGSLNIGGTEKHLLNLINNFDKKEFSIHLHLLNEKGTMFSKMNKDVKVYYPKKTISTKFFHLINFFRTFIRIKLAKPDIIHCFLPQSYVFGGVIGLLLNHKNVIMSRRSLNNYQRKYKIIPLRKIEKLLHKYSKIILANSKAVYSELIDEGVKKEKLKLIYNGVILRNKEKVNIRNLKKELGLKSSKDFIFSSIANLIPYKNQIIIIKAAEMLLKITNKFIIIFVGSGTVQYTNFLKMEIKKRKLNNNVLLLKQSMDVDKYFYISDVGISSSLEEGFSNTILEYLNFGKPVIATNVGGNVDIISKKNGILIESNNHQQMFEAMKRMIINKNDLKKFKDGAKNEVKKYCFEKMIKNYKNVYKNIS
jgi:glycosyltransferase involved in cell wall biosynthesis